MPEYIPPPGPPVAEPTTIQLEYAMPRRRNYSWVIGLAALIAIVIVALGVFTFIVRAALSRAAADRVMCASNLRQIGQGIMLYSNCNKGAYPRTRYNPSAKPTWFTGAADANPFTGPNVKDNDVTAALFMLVRNADINPEVFICPSTNHVKDSLNGLAPTERSNFSGPNNLSYSISNPYVPDSHPYESPRIVSVGVIRVSAVAADRNDGDVKGNSKINSSSPQSDQKKLNSRNHGGDGQNVLFNDGHVEWSTTTFIGHNKDMIYAEAVTVGDPPQQKSPAEFKESGYDPQTDLDSILLPRKGDGF